MVKYKVNLKFKENGRSLNETITDALKIELNKRINGTYTIFGRDVTCESTHYSQSEGSK